MIHQEIFNTPTPEFFRMVREEAVRRGASDNFLNAALSAESRAISQQELSDMTKLPEGVEVRRKIDGTYEIVVKGFFMRSIYPHDIKVWVKTIGDFLSKLPLHRGNTNKDQAPGSPS